jgi:hypothetical protein
MSLKRKTIKLGVAAVVVAALIVAATYFAAPAVIAPSSQTKSQTTSQSTSSQGTISPTYLVLLTDPPQVPTGTEQLNVTYSGVSIQVTAPNGTSSWVSVNVSGTVNLVSLANLTQTIASAKVPAGSLATAVELGISSIQAKINGTTQVVTPLSSKITISVAQPTSANQNVTGAILDLSPTLARTQVVNASSGATTNHFVFVPSGVAIGTNNVNQSQAHVGSKARLSAGEGDQLKSVQSQVSGSISVTSAQLSVSGNKTTFSVTVKNSGDSGVTLFGLLLNGQVNMSMTLPTCPPNPGYACTAKQLSIEHPGAIPFRINGTSLQPLLGFEGQQGVGNVSAITIGAGQSVTLTFSGVISVQAPNQVQAGGLAPASPSIALAPVSGQSYTIRLMGEGFSTFQVTAS